MSVTIPSVVKKSSPLPVFFPDFFPGRHDLIRHDKFGTPRVIAVLQRSTHKLDLILVPGDLCQETAACPHNGNGNDRKFLYSRVWKRGNGFQGGVRIRLFI